MVRFVDAWRRNNGDITGFQVLVTRDLQDAALLSTTLPKWEQVHDGASSAQKTYAAMEICADFFSLGNQCLGRVFSRLL